MSFFKDMISVFRKRELILIESSRETEDVYTFTFKKDKDLTWTAGQYGLFSITNKKIKNPTKPFSIASAPTENVVKITTRINGNPSEFKKAMLELQPGMKIKMGGPVGSFHLDQENPSLLVAAGIGITPFRSILKEMTSSGKQAGKPIHLLYLDSKKSYLFQDELDAMAELALVHITYLGSRDELEQEIVKFITRHKDQGKYFIAGPKSMVESISNFLQNQNISKQNIKKDAFFGL
ncbi:FAD-dependent oxidoreductase [Paenibacillus sp. NPDC058910]|uniref:FAD-dependent oxidoreductase n=1 Tax=unclassified Paenibacillus TaxID=185978 RepID=UPI0036B4129E